MALPHTTNALDYPTRFQFGQSGAPCKGQSCCTDTCIQMIVEYYKEKTYSLSAIRNYAQAKTNFNEAPCTGINHIEALNALEAMGCAYKVSFSADWRAVYNYLNYGPVLVGVHYGSYPNKKGRCGSRNIAEYEGRTDCGFKGAHAVLVVGKRRHVVNGRAHTDFYVRDPDHHSPARPEQPKYDIITAGQLNTAMRNLPRYTAFKTTYMLYTTSKKIIASAPVPAPITLKVMTRTAACNGINLRVSPNLRATVKVQINKGNTVGAIESTRGDSWKVTCPTSKSGSLWYKIITINGKSVKTLYGVDYLFAATGLFV